MRRLVVLAAIAACGDNGQLAPADAAASHGDAAPPDAAVGTVTVSIGGAHPDVAVYFQAADSRMLTRAKTNYAGVASGMMQPGGYVTVVNPYGHDTRSHIRTFAGVQPGDHLVMRERYVPSVFGVFPTAAVHAPGWSDPAVTSWTFRVAPTTYVSTYGGLDSLDVLFEWRAGATTFDFLFLARDANNALRSSVFAANIPAASTIDLSGYPQHAPTQHSIRYTDVPTASAVITESLATERDTLYSVTSPAQAENGTIAIEMQQPVGTDGFNDFTFEASTGFSTIRLIDRRPYTETFKTKVASRLVSEVRTCPAYDATTRTLSWTHAFYRTPNLAVATLRGFETEWTMIAPLDDTSIEFPNLSYEVGGTFGFERLQRAYVPGGYETVRRAEYWPYGDLSDGGGLLGELSISEFSVQSCGAL